MELLDKLSSDQKKMVAAGLGGVLLLVLIVVLWPRGGGSGYKESGPSVRVTGRLRTIVQAMMLYSQDNSGLLPPGDRMVSTLVGKGLLTDKAFVLPEAKSGEASFFYAAPKARQPFADAAAAAAPMVYSNPTLWRDGGVALGYSDGHVEWVKGADATALISGVSANATPLK